MAAERTQLYRNTAENAAKSVGEEVTYKLKKDGVVYTVYNEIRNGQEQFCDFYSNRKGGFTSSSNTQLSARDYDVTTFGDAKVSTENNTAKDADLKNVNDSYVSSREVATPARKTTTELAAERTQLYRNTAENVAKSVGEEVTVIENIEDITDDNPTLQLKKRGVKGWYDPETGKVVINLSTHRDAADIVETVLHETVGHKGIEEMMGKERLSG